MDRSPPAATSIQSALNAGGNVIVDTTNPLGAQAGNITLNSPINKTACGKASLTLNAHNNIVLNSSISSSSAALNLNLNADIDGNGSGATSLASGAGLRLNGGTATANGPISMAANAKIKDAQIIAPEVNSDGSILENILSLNVDSLRLNGGSLQANVKATANTLELAAGSITGSGDLQVTQSFIRTGGSIAGNFSNLAINQTNGFLAPGALSAAGPVTLRAENGQLNLNAPINASTVLARGASGITLSGGAALTASASSGRAITLDAGSAAFLNTVGPAALAVLPSSTWAIYADNPTSTPPANLGGLAYNFKQYNQTFETDQKSNPILGSGNGLFFANSSTLAVNLVPTPQISKVYDGNVTADLVESNYNLTGVWAGDSVNINKPATGVYDNKNAGTGKLVSVSGLTITSATETATGVPVYGYSLPSSKASAAIGAITAKDLLVTGLVANNKIYDATVVAQLSGSAVVSPIAADVVAVTGKAVGTFADKNVAQAKAVSVSGLSLSGNDAGNYSLLPQTNLTAAVTPAPLQISASSDSKIYDGTINSSLIPTITEGSLWGDDVLTGLAQVFESKNALGTGKSRLIVNAYTLSDGNNSNNYVLSLLPGSGMISPANVIPSFTIKSKPYDGSVTAEIAGNSLLGVLAAGDIFVLGASAAFEDPLQGNDKLVSITGFTLSGQAANNYRLSSSAAASTASIISQRMSVSLPVDQEPIKNKERFSL